MIRPFSTSSSPLLPPFSAAWKPYRAFALVLVFHLLGITWGRPLVWHGVHPDFALGGALCLALLGGWEVGVWAGALAGVLLMWTEWKNPGSLLVSRVVAPLVVGWLAPRVPPLHWLVPPLAGFLGALLADGAFVLLSPRAMPPGFWMAHTPRFALVQLFWMWPLMLVVARVAKVRKRLLFPG